MDVESRIKGAPWRWPLLLSLSMLNVCLPNLVLSYGALLVHSVNHGLPQWLGFAAPTIFILTFYLTQCWCRDAADSWGGRTGYRAMATVGLLLMVAGLVTCAFVPYHFQPLIFGVLGGLGSSLISAQVDAVIFDTYDMRLGVIRGMCFAGQAVGQAVFPHIITALVDYYGYSMAYILLGAIMLQTLPAVMILKVEGVRRPVSYSRYSDLAKTYALFDNENNYYTNDLQLNTLASKKSWKSPADDNLHYNDFFEESTDNDNDVGTVTVTPPPSPEEKRKNIFGVEILPEIPEESEDSDDERNKNKYRLSAAIKRLSSIGDSFDEYIAKQIRSDSTEVAGDQYTELSVTYDHIAPMTEIEKEKVFNSLSFRCQSAFAGFRRKLWMPSYKVYRFKRRTQYCFNAINDTFVKPLTRSLSCWRFYPALLLSFARLSLMAVSLALLPIIDFQLSPAISMLETNFMISLHGFTWISFLLATPWLAVTPKRNYKYVTVVGLSVSSVACFVIATMRNHDAFCVGCVLAGLGFGAVMFCWEAAAQDFVGAHKWPKVHSTLETLSGTILALFVGGLCYALKEEAIDLHMCLFILAASLAGIAVVWLVISAISFYKQEIRFFSRR